MLFGRFLINKKAITEEQLIDALVEQMQSTPPLIKILSEVVDTGTLIKAVNLQLDEGKSLYQVQSDCKVFSDTVFFDALEKQKMYKQPIGQILLSQGVIESKTLEELLMEFVANEQNFKESKPPVEENSSSDEPEISDAALESLKELVDGGTVDASALNKLKEEKQINEAPAVIDEPKIGDTSTETEEPEISEAALESLRELAASGSVDSSAIDALESNVAKPDSIKKYIVPLDEDFILPYMEEVTIKKIKELNVWINELKNITDSTEFLKKIDSIFNTFHKFKGIATLANAGLSIKILQNIEDELIKLQSNYENTDVDSSTVGYLLEGMTLVMAISKYIEARKSEEVVLEDAGIIDRITLFIND